MRTLLSPLVLAVAVACTSDNALLAGVDPVQTTQEPEPTSPDPEPEPPPQVDTELAGLSGKVCAPDGETSIAHATVTLHADRDYTAETNGLGNFQLYDLPPGEWDVSIDKGSFHTALTVELVAGEVTRLTVDDCAPIEQGETKIAVVTGEFDDIGSLVSDLQFDYDTINGRSGTALRDFLLDEDRMARYDVIFFNCGIVNNWTQDQGAIAGNLRQYVRNGGSIYASDWAYWLVEKGWPDEHNFAGPESRIDTAFVGLAGRVTGDVRDQAMADALGRDTADLRYDLDAWAAMDGAPDAEVLIRGEYRWMQGFSVQTAEGPLATRLYDGDGEVLFTTFHNERQTTGDMLILLREIILSL